MRSAARLPAIPDVHTLSDLGLPDDMAHRVRVVGTGLAVLFLLLGILRLLFGWRIFHRMFPLYAALLGLCAAAFVGLLVTGAGAPGWAILAGAALGAVGGAWVARRVERYAVMLFAAGDAAWLAGAAGRHFALPDAVAAASSSLAFVAVAYLAYRHYRAVVIVGTSVEGAFVILVCTLGLLFLCDVQLPRLLRPLHADPVVVALTTLTLAVVGVVHQLRAVRAAKDSDADQPAIPLPASPVARQSTRAPARRKAA